MNVDWQLARRSESYQIVDVLTEGVSMAITMHAEYGSFLKRHGGNVAELTTALGQRFAPLVKPHPRDKTKILQ